MRLKSNPETVVGYSYVTNPDVSSVEVMSFMIDTGYIQNGNLKSYQADSLAIDLQTEIVRQEMTREAYYNQYDANAFNKLPSLAEVAQTQFMAAYAWSQGGGFHSEEPTYIGSRDSGSGGSFSFLGMTGYSASDPTPLKSWSFKAMFGGHLNLTMKKDDLSSDTVTLHTNFDGSKLDSGNLQPGQVAAYSWATFCTDESTDNFDTLFYKVIDKSWLIGNSPTANVFLDMMKARRPVWRILHRVTDVTPA